MREEPIHVNLVKLLCSEVFIKDIHLDKKLIGVPELRKEVKLNKNFKLATVRDFLHFVHHKQINEGTELIIAELIKLTTKPLVQILDRLHS